MKTRLIQDQKEFEAFQALYKELEAIIPTMKVKTASATPAGNKVQVRVTWKEPGGKRGLGYFSQYVVNSTLQGILSWKDFLIYTLRLDRKSLTRQAMNLVMANPKLMATVNAIVNEANSKLKAVVATNQHQTVKSQRKKAKARNFLIYGLDAALANGFTEIEIQELLKEAIVKSVITP